ncbi:MAG: hypothetical protein NTX59_04860 [Elusimicrobia bacterium]|nr:hypothetical protein [Elusimicrobiota bacterium]
MTDAYYLIETALLCASPFALIVIGILLRRKFKPVIPPEGAEAPQRSSGHKAARLLGNFLLAAGVCAVILCGVFLLNYLGKI